MASKSSWSQCRSRSKGKNLDETSCKNMGVQSQCRSRSKGKNPKVFGGILGRRESQCRSRSKGKNHRKCHRRSQYDGKKSQCRSRSKGKNQRYQYVGFLLWIRLNAALAAKERISKSSCVLRM